ncbi:DUF397 domain-containing protein [Streptomyces noursei]|uniref:DUF397 domain-containing protein n=1 Tax=Streptomyces noursei TaxID=1971 RepID=UPI00081D077A|nr:protein of unknown function (DUF397) [Streptomyces noursei ATCC 11455]MCZ0996343.1 DUF397 domain-containing protein [Streptomyces noursei]MCZ0996846.1 DUF397 domain-containing protein [Streptomyces noursei]
MTTEFPEFLRWYKSSYSGNGGQCVEVAANLVASRGVVPVRDSKDPHGPAVSFPVTSFSAFIAAVKNGAF